MLNLQSGERKMKTLRKQSSGRLIGTIRVSVTTSHNNSEQNCKSMLRNDHPAAKDVPPALRLQARCVLYAASSYHGTSKTTSITPVVDPVLKTSRCMQKLSCLHASPLGWCRTQTKFAWAPGNIQSIQIVSGQVALCVQCVFCSWHDVLVILPSRHDYSCCKSCS